MKKKYSRNWRSEVDWLHHLATDMEKLSLGMRGDNKREIVRLRLLLLERISNIETPRSDYD